MEQKYSSLRVSDALALASGNSPNPSTSSAAGADAREAQIKHMADRFLGWKLPDHFSPDNGVTFTPTPHQRGEYGKAHWPNGTNLFDATQAAEMVRYMLDGLGDGENQIGAAEREVGQYVYQRIEALMDAKTGTADAAELDYLADIAVHVEEYGPENCGGESLSPFPGRQTGEQLPVEHENEDGWSDWIHPAPGYRMQCCDCGLIHRMDFEIVAPNDPPPAFNPGESEEGIIVFRASRERADEQRAQRANTTNPL
jgi:hypothetical protein